MTTVNITKLDFSIAPGIPQTFWMDWAAADTPLVWNTLPNINTDASGVPLLPYSFSVPDAPIIVRARNEKKCGDWFAKDVNICAIVEPSFNINP